MMGPAGLGFTQPQGSEALKYFNLGGVAGAIGIGRVTQFQRFLEAQILSIIEELGIGRRHVCATVIFGREALHRHRQDRPDAALGVSLRLLLDLADDPRGVVARLVLDVSRRKNGLLKVRRVELGRWTVERRDDLRQQLIFGLLGQLPVGQLGVVAERVLRRATLRLRGIKGLIGQDCHDDEGEDQQCNGADQAGGATHDS